MVATVVMQRNISPCDDFGVKLKMARTALLLFVGTLLLGANAATVTKKAALLIIDVQASETANLLPACPRAMGLKPRLCSTPTRKSCRLTPLPPLPADLLRAGLFPRLEHAPWRSGQPRGRGLVLHRSNHQQPPCQQVRLRPRGEDPRFPS